MNNQYVDHSVDLAASGTTADPILNGHNISPSGPGLGVTALGDSKSTYYVDLNYPEEDNATPNPFPSPYEFSYAENMRIQNVTHTPSSTLPNEQDDTECQLSHTQQEVEPGAAQHKPTSDREEIRKLAMEGRRRVFLQMGEDLEQPLAVPPIKGTMDTRVLPPHLVDRIRRSKTYSGVNHREFSSSCPQSKTFFFGRRHHQGLALAFHDGEFDS
jgi:hypothetical protein